VLIHTVRPDLTIPAVPPSDNERKMLNRKTGRMFTNPEVKMFKKHTAAALRERLGPRHLLVGLVWFTSNLFP